MSNNIPSAVEHLDPAAGAGRDLRARFRGPPSLLAAETRAVEEGHVARVLANGSVLVKAESRPGSYLVRVRDVRRGVVTFDCSCPSGHYRRQLPVPCKHAALVGRRLEREGLATWAMGVWHLRPRAALRAALAATGRSRSASAAA